MGVTGAVDRSRVTRLYTVLSVIVNGTYFLLVSNRGVIIFWFHVKFPSLSWVISQHIKKREGY